jgi:hypothetical protein
LDQMLARKNRQQEPPGMMREIGATFKSRGDKTAIELFVAGVRGWEAGLRRFLAPSADGK